MTWDKSHTHTVSIYTLHMLKTDKHRKNDVKIHQDAKMSGWKEIHMPPVRFSTCITWSFKTETCQLTK